MRVIGETKDRTYRTGRKSFDITPGAVYEIEYNEQHYVGQWGATVLIWLNSIRPAAPTSSSSLVDILALVTSKGRAQAILDRMKAQGVNVDGPVPTVLAAISDRRMLCSVDGIGASTADQIIAKLKTISGAEIALAEALSRWGIKVDRSTQKYKWTAHYYECYPAQLVEVETNPYRLLTIANPDSSQVRQALENPRWTPARATVPRRPATLSLAEIDAAVLPKDKRWFEYRDRVTAILESAFARIESDGHSVAEMSQMRSELARLQIKGVRGLYHKGATPDLDGQRYELTDSAVKDLVRSTSSLVNTTFVNTGGETLDGVTTKRIARWQQTISGAVTTLTAAPPVFSRLKVQEMTNVALQSAAFTLTPEQQQAVRFAFGSRFSAITGGAGVGKTATSQTILNGYLKATIKDTAIDAATGDIIEQDPFSLYIVAPTGVAAQRIRIGLDLHDPITGEIVIPNKIDWSIGDDKKNYAPGYVADEGRVCIGTLHSFLGYNGHSFHIPNPHPSIIFLDETSMVDEEPMAALMTYVSRCEAAHVPVVLMMSGDENQLPPVGVGFPFRDLLGGRFGAALPTTRLNKVQRQAAGSVVVQSSHRILKGECPPTMDYECGKPHYEIDFLWMEPARRDDRKIARLVTDYQSYLQNVHDIGTKNNEIIRADDIQVILPLRNQSKIEPSAFYVDKVNEELQEFFAEQRGQILNRFVAASLDDEEKTYTVRFAIGDKIIHSGRNGYGADKHEPVMRGSIGRILDVVDNPEGQPTILVEYPWMEQPVSYTARQEVGQLKLAYAITGHASQGSEFDYVLLVLPDAAGPGLVDRSWLYTAVTRARKHLFMIGSQARVKKAVSHSYGMNRNTLLAKELVRIHG